jgi:hypothetical protein
MGKKNKKHLHKKIANLSMQSSKSDNLNNPVEIVNKPSFPDIDKNNLTQHPIKQELIKVGLTFTILLLLLILVTILNSRTELLNNFSDKLSNILHII